MRERHTSAIAVATRRHYDRHPYEFETAVHAPMQLDDTLLGEAVAGLATGAVAVDVGCGTGIVSRLLAEGCPGATVIGVDLSLGSLRRAQATRHRVLVQGDNLRLPLASGAADLVVSRGVIMTTGAPRRAFGELARLVRPGGRLFVRVYNRDHPYRWIFGLLGPLCRAVQRLPGGEALLRATAYPLFLAVLHLGLIALSGRPTRVPGRVGWSLFADQLLTPHNSFHAPDELLGWGAAEGLTCLRHQAITLGQQIELLFARPAR